jgi:hypothetical protein
MVIIKRFVVIEIIRDVSNFSIDFFNHLSYFKFIVFTPNQNNSNNQTYSINLHISKAHKIDCIV